MAGWGEERDRGEVSELGSGSREGDKVGGGSHPRAKGGHGGVGTAEPQSELWSPPCPWASH